MTERTRETTGRLPLTLSNIYPGREFATYKEFCNELGLEIKTGGMKIRQMKEIEKILKISTRGWKIRIEEIRNGEELKEIERREGEERLERDCEKNLNEKVSVNQRKFLEEKPTKDRT